MEGDRRWDPEQVAASYKLVRKRRRAENLRRDSEVKERVFTITDEQVLRSKIILGGQISVSELLESGQLKKGF